MEHHERRLQALRAKQARLEEQIERLEHEMKRESQAHKERTQREKKVGRLLLGLDVGTTGAKAFVYDEQANCIANSYKEMTPIRDEPGKEEQCPKDLWEKVVHLIKKTLKKASVEASDISAMGITTQRNSIVMWDKYARHFHHYHFESRETGEPVCNFITWQDTRTARYCHNLNKSIACRSIRAASALAYRMTRNIKFALGDKKRLLKANRLLFGMVDTWLIWKLTGGAVHATDHSNISSTGMWDSFDMTWNLTITNLCNIPLSIMPEIRPSSGDYGETLPELFGAPIPIRANCADQGAALFGECCFSVGDTKITAGTGCFLDINTGEIPIGSPEGLYPFVAWSIGDNVTYMMEGLASTIGTVVNWSRNHLGIFEEDEQTSEIASSVPSTEGVYFVPAFSGLSGPRSDGGARGAITGLTVNTTKAHIVRAMLEGIAYSINDLMTLAEKIAILPDQPLRINGGLVQNDFLCQFLADVLDRPLDRPQHPCNGTAVGIIFLAGLAAGVWNSTDELAALRHTERVFHPAMNDEHRQAVLNGWQTATIRSLSPHKLRKMKRALRKQERAKTEKEAFEMNRMMKDLYNTFKWAASMRQQITTKHSPKTRRAHVHQQSSINLGNLWSNRVPMVDLTALTHATAEQPPQDPSDNLYLMPTAQPTTQQEAM